MERDFMGLSSKELSFVVKEEVITDGYKEIGFTRGSSTHWPFSNKVSALPQFMPFRVAPEDKTKQIVSDPLMSSGYMSFSSADAYDPTRKNSVPEIQKKTFNHERQIGTNLSLSAYPMQHDMHSGYHPHDGKMFPATNNVISVSVSNPFFKNQYATAGQNVITGTIKPQLLGGIPVTSPQPAFPIGSVAGMTESCAKPPGSPAQLTIFYAGAVNVYDDISPEKAQAIMFLAENGPSVTSNLMQPKVRIFAPSSTPVSVDVSPVNLTPPCSRLSSPLSVSSHIGAHSGSGSTSTEEIVAAKTTGFNTSPVRKLDPPKLTSAMVSIAAPTIIPSVPQARKASLARFLEKRKERVMNAAPYNLNKKCFE